MKGLFTILTTLILLFAVGCNEQGGGDINPNEPTPENIFFGLDKETVTISPDGGSVDVIVYSNYKWEISGTSDWCTPSATSGEANEDGQKVSFSADVAYDNREATFWFRCADEKIKFTVSQSFKEAIIADENNTFSVPAEGGNVILDYQTTVECEVIIPEEAQGWISLASGQTRGLVSESKTLTVAENTTYSERSAVVKVVKVGDNSLFAEYTINQVQNDAIIAENNTFKLKGLAQSIDIAYKTNVECDVIIPEEAQSWISIAPKTRALVDESVTLNVADNNTGAARSAIVKVVATNNSELFAEYTITQAQRYYIEYTSTNGSTITPYSSSAFGATIIRNEYTDGKGYIDFDAPVTSIGGLAFDCCTSLTSVTIPDSVTSIGNYAFRNCTSLASVTIPDSVTSIGNYAFHYCTSLTSITIPDSVTSIGSHAFSGCTSLASVTIGNGVTSIGYEAFHNCTSLTSITIPDGVTSIGSYAFSGCTSLTSITIPDSVTSIGDSAFAVCTSLTSVTIPDGVTSIGSYAFAGCSSMVSFQGKLASEDGRCLIIKGVLNSFAPAGLTEYTIPDGVTSIGYRAFYSCTSLTSITIPDSVTSIGDSAFADCTSLTSITIPDSVTSIGSSVFSGCTSLTSITIPDSVTSIGSHAFDCCTSLASVTIPDGVTSIGYRAFYSCTSLASVTIPDSVTEIGDEAFYDCGGELIINSKIVEKNYSIDNYPQDYGWLRGAKFTKLTIGDSVTSIGQRAFYNCTSLASVTIPDSVTEIGRDAFAGCTSLTSITIPDSVNWIGRDAFSGCASLTSVTIPDSVTSIGKLAFAACTSLASVYCKPTTPPSGDYDMFAFNASGRKIYVSTESVDAYKTANHWSDYKSSIEGYDFE